MSVIIATFENGELMPSRADGFFRYHDHESTMVDETGHVESHIGHATLRRVTFVDIATYASRFGDNWASHRSNLEPGWYVDVRGEDGTIWAFAYGGWCREHDDLCADTHAEQTARRDFAEACRVYAEWVNDYDAHA